MSSEVGLLYYISFSYIVSSSTGVLYSAPSRLPTQERS